MISNLFLARRLDVPKSYNGKMNMVMK